MVLNKASASRMTTGGGMKVFIGDILGRVGIGIFIVRDCVFACSANAVAMESVEIGLSLDIVVHDISVSSIVNGFIGNNLACTASLVISAIVGYVNGDISVFLVM